MPNWKVNCNTLYLGHVVVIHCSPSISCTPHCHWHKDDDECLGLPGEYEPVECCCLRAERLHVSAAGAHLHLTESLCPRWNVSLAANAPGKSSFSSEAHCTCVSVSQLRTLFVLFFQSFYGGAWWCNWCVIFDVSRREFFSKRLLNFFWWCSCCEFDGRNMALKDGGGQGFVNPQPFCNKNVFC